MDAARLFVRITVAGADTSAATLRGFGAQINTAQKGLDRIGYGAGRMAQGAVRAGTLVAGAAAVGSIAAVKMAADWEDAFAAVEKTVSGPDAGPAQLGALNKELRALATRIPVQYTDLAGIAAEAGALGVPAEIIDNFSETVARLSAATVGLTTGAASEAFGKLGNVLGLNADKTGKSYERLGSALIELGNNAASSESDIIEVAKRFGAAGAQAGLSAAQILGFSSAVASLGVEPEAAGGALSRVFNRVNTLLGTGDDKMKTFAKTAGMTVKEFTAAWRDDGQAAMEAFLVGLDKIEDPLRQAAILKKSGITNQRDINVIQLLAAHHGELARQVDLSTKAFDENTALATVSATRFDTLKNHAIVLFNTIKEGAVQFGEGITPSIGRLVAKLQPIVEGSFGDLRKLGKDIGKAIDDIDFREVEKNARTLLGVGQQFLDVIKQVPAEVALAVVAFQGFNKLSGGAGSMIAGGAIDVAGGVLGMGARSLGRLGGGLGRVGGIASALTSTPVYITGVAPGVMLGGGLPGAAGAIGAGVGLGTAAFAGFAALAVGAVAYVANEESNKINTQAAALSKQTADFAKTASDRELADAIDGLRGKVDEMGTGIGSNMFNQKNITIDQLNTLIAAQNARNTPPGEASAVYGPPRPGAGGWGGNRGYGPKSASAMRFDQGGLDLSSTIHDAFVKGMRNLGHAIATGMNDSQVRKDTRKLLDVMITQSRGGLHGTERAIASLRSALRNTDDKRTRTMLIDGIHALERRLPERRWVHDQVDLARRIERGGGTHAEKIARLTRIQTRMLEHGHPKWAARIGQEIAEEKNELSKTARAEGIRARRALRDKDLSVQVDVKPQPVNLDVNGRRIASAMVPYFTNRIA